MKCPNCSFENRDAAKFCEHCGKPLAPACPRCGEALSPQAQFCGNCGFDLANPPPASRPSALRPSAPATLQEKIRAAGSQLDGERKAVTILFTDVVGSTALAEKLDPEEWRHIISGAHQRVCETVCRYEGTIAQLLGDGVLAFFGAPITREDDPVRAVRAALHIQSAITDYACTLKGLVEDFQMRIGINTGLVVVGNIGSDQHMEYLAIGDAVNLAARLQSAAPPGQVLLSEATARLVKATFELKSLGEIALKGKADLVSVFQVVQTKTTPEDTRGIQGLTSPLVGRDQAVATFKQNLERLLAGQGGIVSIIGEAGVGKSRLMAEMRKVIAAEHLDWLEGRTLSFGQTISYWPFQEILRRYAGITEEDSEPATWDKLESAITALFAENTIEILPYLASLLALEVKGEYAERVKYLDGEAMRHQVFLVSRRFFERLAQTQPVVLIFEDLHWVDESSALLIEHLLPLVERAPLLICGISRPDPETPAARLRDLAAMDFASRYTEIRLAPLSETESAQLVRNLLASETFAPQLQELIVRKAEGNPFFLEEIIRSLIDTGVVVRDAATGRWHATAKAETVTIPDTVQGVILARVDRLDEDLRQVLRTAAVIGRSFLYRILRAIAEADRHLDEHLTELQALEFIREKQRMPELEYIFKHALAQEATYESILLQKRRELHAQVGQVIETLFADRLEEFYSLLAYHYARAEAWEKAHDYLLKAADQAGRMAADTEALAHYQQAIAVYARAFGDKWDPFQRAVLERKMGESYVSLGRFTESIVHFKQAVALLGHPMPDTRARMLLGIAIDVVRQGLRLVFPKQFKRTVSRTKGASAGLLEAYRAYERQAFIRYLSSELTPFVSASLRGLDLAEEIGPSPELARAYGGNCGTIGVIGFHAVARYYERCALELAHATDDPSALAWVLLTTGTYRLQVCDWAQSRMSFSRGLEIAERIGELRTHDELSSCLSNVLRYQGNLSGSIASFLNDYASANARQDPVATVLALCGQVENELAIDGPTDRILGLLFEAESLLRTERMDLPDEINMGGLLARLYLYRGEAKRAQQAAEKSANVIARTMPTTFYTIEGYAGTTEAFLALWQMAEGQSQVADLRSDIKNLKSRARQSCRALMGFARVFAFAQPRAWLWQGVYEWQAHKPSAAQSAWEKSIQAAQKFAMPYEEALAHYEIGRRLGDRAHLERAIAVFAEIGAEWDLARARVALASVTK